MVRSSGNNSEFFNGCYHLYGIIQNKNTNEIQSSHGPLILFVMFAIKLGCVCPCLSTHLHVLQTSSQNKVSEWNYMRWERKPKKTINTNVNVVVFAWKKNMFFNLPNTEWRPSRVDKPSYKLHITIFCITKITRCEHFNIFLIFFMRI